ncbi:hypothetical protein N0V84_009504 [Fusarium piperis]|uniref:Uncharacterized protein n=1 Tax=Fusarium piperis TaxID=1435070 RepID=A0A9W9BK38_9HYPO|nr:hypothetical protein N0V84_009504 [Fusarium piperis]
MAIIGAAALSGRVQGIELMLNRDDDNAEQEQRAGPDDQTEAKLLKTFQSKIPIRTVTAAAVKAGGGLQATTPAALKTENIPPESRA